MDVNDITATKLFIVDGVILDGMQGIPIF